MNRLAWGLLAAGMALAGLLLLWEGRGQTLFVDEWTFGFGLRPDSSLDSLLKPDNGHLAVVPVLITKAWLNVFGATDALPLRIVAAGFHLAAALALFVFLRRSVGPLVALFPVGLVLVFGSAADVLIGSHAMPIEIAVATGLWAWLALERRSTGWDAVAGLLLLVGIASNGFALPFVAGAAAILLLDSGLSRRLWVLAVPLAPYALWRLTYGGEDQSNFALAHVASLPSYFFDSLAAVLAAITGLFVQPGVEGGGVTLDAGRALAGALLVALLAAGVAGRYRPPRTVVPPLVALLSLWLVTGLVVGPGRFPGEARYLYGAAILVFMIAAAALAPTIYRQRGAIVLAGICVVGLAPNLDRLHEEAKVFREQSDQNRATLAAAGLLGSSGPADLWLEDGANPNPGGVAELAFPLGRYLEAEREYGTPALSLAELEAAGPASREAADWLLNRAFGFALAPPTGPPARLPAGTEASQTGGRLATRGGCILFEPLVPAAQTTVGLPAGGLWVKARPGLPVQVRMQRFSESFPIDLGHVLGGRAAVVMPGRGPAASGWEVQVLPHQPVRICAAVPGR